MQTMPVLLLNTTGRTSGKPRTVPLTYLRDGSTYVIIASNTGLPRHPAWFLNLQRHPETTILVQQVQVKAETAKAEKKRELWIHLMEVYMSKQTIALVGGMGDLGTLVCEYVAREGL